MKRVSTSLSRYLSSPTINILLIIVLLVTSIPSTALAQVAKNSPPTKPIDVTATQVGLNQVDVRWTVTDLSATGYRIEGTSDPSFLTGVTKISVSHNNSAFSDKTVLVGNVYFYRVFAYNTFGDSLPSNVAIVSVSNSFLPSPGTPQVPPVVSTEQPSIITESSATLVGSLKQLGSAGKVLTYFQWGYDTGYGNIAEPKALSSPGSFSTVLKNLRPNRTYHYRAVAVGQGVGTVYGNDRVFTTLPSASPSSALRPVPPAIVLGGSQSVVVRATAAQDNDLKSPSNKISLKVPKGALNRDTDIELTEYGPARTTGKQILSQFELKAKEVGTSANVRQFGKDLQIKIVHDADDLKGLDTRSLHLYYFDEGRKSWVPVPSTYDAMTRTLTATVNHFTYFGEMANPLKSGPGLITAFQNDLQTGAATGTYPIEVPPGPGGFQPKITLQYNSGSVDEMKNRRSVGSWVGIGWSLSLGAISYDEANNKYSLELNGTGYTLVEGANNTYYTHPDKHLKVTRSGNQWDVWDREGNYYRFGGTNDTQQYHDINIYYRWDLSRMQGAASNLTFIDITYAQDTWNGTIRSAYPSILKYTDGQGNDTVRVSFNSSFDYTSADGNMRFDTPNGTTLNPTPAMVENKKLDSIEVRVYSSGNWTLVRKYNFTYNTTNSVYSADYGAIYYSGNFTLASITQKDSSDNLSLPTTTFTYEGKQTYLMDASTSNYSGNPGNPASFSWPHLTTINNGYGANVTYTYTQIPDTAVTDIWTRQVVAIKTVNSGIGPEETHIYTYTGYPQYLVNDGNEWEAKFRGFTQVQDTDAAGNYVIHYFNTIDPDDGNAEKLNGLETKTEWYSSNGTLLRKVENQWGWSESVQAYDLLRRWGAISQFAAPKDVAVADNGTIFVADTDNNRILKYTSTGTLIGMWGSLGNGNGQFNNPSGIAVAKPGGWWDNDWGIRTKLTFNTTSISTNLTSFPVLVHLTSTNFNFSRAQEDGGDLRFIDADNTTVLDYEIERWTGSEAWIWVRVPQLAGNSTSDFIWVYYGNSNASDGWNSSGVWDSNHKMVHHFEDIKDSTSNANHGSMSGMNSSANVTGKINGCLDFDGVDDRFIVSDRAYWQFTNFSISLWVKADSWSGGWWTRAFVAQDEGGGSTNKWIFSYGGGTTLFHINDIYDEVGGVIARGNSWTPDTGVWYQLGITRSGNNFYFYRNGAADGTATETYTVPDANAPLTIAWGEGTGGFNGMIEEVRISDVARSADWMKASYLSDTDSLITFVAPETSSVYVVDTNNNRIQIFDFNGLYLNQWGNNGTGDGNFTSPQGIAVSPDGYIYVADTGYNRIQKFTMNGTFLGKWGTNGTSDGNFSAPAGVAVEKNGNVYVADTNNNRIQKFSSNGTFITKWYGSGNASGNFSHPQGVTVDDAGNVYVTDTDNNRLQKFTSNGDFITSWGGSSQFNSPRGISMATNWWDSSWRMRNKLTFNTTGISSSLINFPVLVHLTPNIFNFSYAQGDGGDLRFIDADGTTVLDYEIERWTTNESWVWVKVPQLYGNSTTDHMWIYYGNPNASDGWNQQSVWDSNHLMVQHMKETSINGTTGEVKDSTSYGNNGTTSGMNASAQVVGKVNGNFAFDGNDDRINVPDNNAWAFGNFTISVWVKADSWSGGWWTRAFVAQDAGPSTNNKWILSHDTATLFHIYSVGTGGTYIRGNSWTPQTGVWYLLGITKSGNNYTFYRNGAADGSPTDTLTIPNVAAPLTIGWAEGNGGFNGMIDEVRLSNTARSTDWMKASYLSETDSLITYGAAETAFIYVADTNNNRIQKYDASGNFSAAWGSYGSGNASLATPKGVAISSNGSVYVVDSNSNHILKFTGTGNYTTSWGSYGNSTGQFAYPYGITIGPDGSIYVADKDNNRIQKFTGTGNYTTSWGGYGNVTGNFSSPTGIAVDNSSYVYVVDTNNNRIQKFTSNGTFNATWGSNETFKLPQGIAIGPDGYIYIADTGNHSVQKYTSSGNFVASWGGYGTGNGKFNSPQGIAVDNNGTVYVADTKNYRVQTFNSSGNFVASWVMPIDGDYDQREPMAIAVGSDGYVYVTSGSTVKKFVRDFSVHLDQVTQTVGSKVTQTRYMYDSYGNVVTEYQDGETANATDNRTIWRVYYPNIAANILGKVARERVYSGTVTSDNGGADLKSETIYYYDGNNGSYNTSPTKGLLTRVETKKDASSSISGYFTYDNYGNKLTDKDPSGNITSTVFDSTYRTYPIGKAFPISGLSENYTYDPGTTNMLTLTDINGQVTTYTYDTFKRLISVDKPLGRNPDIQYEYNNWGTLNQQHIKTKTWTDNSTYLWQSQFFDGLGRVVQVQSNGETNYTIVSSTLTYNARGLIDKEFVTQSLSGNLTSYQTPQANWKFVTYAYDGLGRVTQKINADATWTTHDLATTWQDTVTNERGFNTVYFLDAFSRLIKVQEPAGAPSYDFSLKWNTGGTGNLTYPQGIAAEANGNIYVADTGNHLIKKFNSSGSFIAEYGGYGNVSGNFNGPAGVAVDNNGNFYVADTNNNRIQKFTSNGTFNTTWNGSGNASGTFNHPQGLAVDYTGYIYVADTNNNRIQKFTSNGTFIIMWGAYGSESGNFSYPQGVAVDTNGFVYVADTSNHRVQKFDSNGNFLAVIGSYGTAPGRFNAPAGIAADAFGIIYVADTDNSRIQKIDSGGDCIVWWGGNGTNDGKVDHPYGLVVNQSGDVYVADTNNNRVQKFIPASQSPSPVTNYDYDIMGNLIQVTDATGNITSISYDWFSRKTAMVDPDMGGWGYTYDKNGNLATQTDNKSQTITFTYDALNRLKGKTYPAGANITNVTYSYDSGTYGKGQRTSMVDAGGNTTYQYDQRGRLITENRTFTGDNNTYVTRFGYDGADWVIWIIYPTGENVTQTYSRRGLSYTLSGNVSGNLVTSTYYNALGQITEINLNNGLRSTFGYWGMGGMYDTAGGYYGRLWEIKTLPQAGGTALMDVQHAWDAGGNLASRTDVLVSQTETFAYDTLSRLTSVTGPYSENYTYNAVGNILSKNGVSYTYGSKPHAVTSFGSTNYTYDNNGNMLTRGSQNITWDAENRPVSIAFNSVAGTTWWSNNWTKRNKLSFNTTTISSNLTNFPVLVHLTSSNFVFGYAQADGGDLRFIDADGTTVLDYEIEKWTGSEAWVWVKVPVLTGNSTTDFMWMYFNNSAATNGWNPSGVWDSNHKMVHHLEETDIDGGTGDIKDTTTYGNNGTTVGMNTADQVAGKVDGNFDFDGTDDHINVPDNNAWAFGDFTISVWVKANSWSGSSWTRAFVGQDEGGGETNKWFFSYNGATVFMVNTAGDNNGGTYVPGNSWTAQTGVWYHLAVTRSGNNYTFYRDGAIDGSPTNSHTIPNVNAPLTVAWAEGAGGFNGMIDEVRISDTARSADWMKASYLSETDAIINYGATENFGGNAWWDTGWSMRNKLTFNTTSISSNLTNFPVLVHLTSSNFSFGYAQADGGDLRFIDADNTTVLDYEIEKWTGSEAWVWVRVPQLAGNSTSDFIWIYWNNANAANGWNPVGVWDANFVLVDHMVDNPDNAHTKDSTNNSNNGTKAAANQPLETVGKIGRGQEFNGTSGSYVLSGNSSSLNPTNAITIETLAKRSGNGTYDWPHLVTKSGQYLLHAFNSGNGAQSNLYVNGQEYNLYYADGLPVGQWKHLSVTYDGATGKILDAGTVVTSQNISGSLATSSSSFRISNTFNGTIDEVRISNVARSADWLKATYLTQSESLVSFGSTETIGSAATFVYDGDGNRVKKTDNGETILYVNKYYEKNLTTGNVTTRYYLGDKLVAEREGTTLRYFHQDSLSSTSLMTDSSGNSLGTMKNYPFGSVRSGSVPTNIQFTGQRLDDTGLYYYGARYYDSNIGRFISPDTFVQVAEGSPKVASQLTVNVISRGPSSLVSPRQVRKAPINPQTLNRYAYVLNNPLKYTDQSGSIVKFAHEEEVLFILGNGILPDGSSVQPGSEAEKMVQEYLALTNKWNELRKLEPEYTQLMMDSEITFDVEDVNVKEKSVTYNADLKGGLSFNKPTTLHFVNEDETPLIMDVLGAGAITLPSGIWMNTSVKRDVKRFTNDIAHEMYHEWERDRWGGWVMSSTWYLGYIGNGWGVPFGLKDHADMIYEMRANWYADRYYPIE